MAVGSTTLDEVARRTRMVGVHIIQRSKILQKMSVSDPNGRTSQTLNYLSPQTPQCPPLPLLVPPYHQYGR
jgi:hypothetical protein